MGHLWSRTDLGWGLKIHIPEKVPGDADAAGPGSPPKNHSCSHTLALIQFRPSLHFVCDWSRISFYTSVSQPDLNSFTGRDCVFYIFLCIV